MTVHLTLQGKGGVGKTLVSNLLAQHQKSKGVKLICIDTDPVNRSFYSYKSLDVECFNLMSDDNIDQTLFDNLVERIIENSDFDFIIDNGASSFIPLTRYIIENDVIKLLNDHNIEVNIHSVVTGGESMNDTLQGLLTLFENIPTSQIYVWLNEFFGPIRSGDKSFPDMKIYKDNKSRIKGVVLIPQLGELFTADMKHILTEKLTIDDALSSAGIRIMTKSRLKKIQNIIFSNLDEELDVSKNTAPVVTVNA